MLINENQKKKFEVDKFGLINIQGIEVDYAKFIDIFQGEEVQLMRRLQRDHSVKSQFEDIMEAKGQENSSGSMVKTRFKNNNFRRILKNESFVQLPFKDKDKEKEHKSIQYNEEETQVYKEKDNIAMRLAPVQNNFIQESYINVVQIRKPSFRDHDNTDPNLADHVCIIPPSLQTGLEQQIPCLPTAQFETDIYSLYTIKQEIKQINSNKTTLREGIAIHCSDFKVADLVWVNKNLNTLELKNFDDPYTYVLKQIFYQKKSNKSIHLMTADWWTIFPEKNPPVQSKEQAQQPFRKYNSQEITQTNDVIVTQRHLSMGTREFKNWKCMVTNPVVRRIVRCQEEGILPDQQVTQLEDTEFVRVGLLLETNYGQNKFKEKKHQIQFVDKIKDSYKIKEQMDKFQ